MTSRAAVAAAGGREERGKGVGRRLLSRMKTVLKKADPSKRASMLPAGSTQPAPPASPSTATATATTIPATTVDPSTIPATTPAPSQPSQPLTESALFEVDDASPTFEGEKIARSQIYGERAQQLSERYGLEMDPYAWYQMDGNVLRVHKSHRVRVHRQCHHCGNEVSQGTQCNKCSHDLCRQCTRYPPKRNEAEAEANRERKAEILRERSANSMITPDWNADPHATVVLRRPARSSDQQELVYKKVRQRVRRTCCQCLDTDGTEVLFQGGDRFCTKCYHARCTDCPRDPPKKDKYPYGYPGDELGVKSTPYYRCHQCYTKFPPGVEHNTPCLKCSHEKCDNCERLLPQKVEPEPDPEILKSVQEKLAAMNVA